MGESSNMNRSSLVEEAVETWFSSLDAGCVLEGFDRLVDAWGMEDVLCTLAERHWGEHVKVAELALGTDSFRHTKRSASNALTVAYFYPSIANGGAQRVAAETCNLWTAQLGTAFDRVVLIINGGPCDDEYPLDSRVRRAFLPPLNKASFRARYQAWQRILDNEGIDIIIYGIGTQASAPVWDVLAVKGHSTRPALVLSVTGFPIWSYANPNDAAATLMQLFRLVDGVSVLSECSCSYVERFCANARYIPNPIDYLADNSESSSLEEHSIIWTGRISKVKQPMDLIYMMGRVVEDVPDARLYLVGCEDKGLEEELRGEVRRLGLEESIVFTGFVTDVDVWYERASVCVCTSKMESFSLSIAEALSHSLPVVMYDMPWLEFVCDGRGIRTVEQGRWDLLAQEVVRLLEAPAEARRLGCEGRGQIDALLGVDVASEWQALFDGIDPGARPAGWDTDERVLFQYAAQFQDEAKQRLRDQNLVLKTELRGCSDRISARIDFKNVGAKSNSLDVIDVSDPFARVEDPAWFRDAAGAGRVVMSDAGSLSFRLRCVGNGELQLRLRGQDVRGSDGKRVPVWIDYTSLVVDGEPLLSEPVAVWHDKPFRHRMLVKDGQIVSVSLSWHSHDEAGVDAARKQAASARERLDASLAEVTALRAENERLRSRAEGLSGMVARQEASIKSLRNVGDAENVARVAAEDEFKAQLQAQKGEIARLSRMITARVDIKNVGAESNSLDVLDVSDPSASVESPAWFRDAAGAGRVVKSSAGSISFRLRCGGNGELQLRLRGQDVRGSDGKRVPVWIDYTSLVVDGEPLLSKPVAVWHDKPFRHRMLVKDGQIVSVSLSWHSHDEQALRATTTWNVGRAVTWLPRTIKALLR